MTARSADWLRAQRWFRSKQRPIASVATVDRAGLAPAVLEVLHVTYADRGGPERYLVPTIADREPAEGEGTWAALVEAVAAGADQPSERGRFRCHRTEHLGALLPSTLAERRLGVEQSNTSVVVGDRLIVKLYRLLESGENPDIEVGAFLTDAGFTDTPALGGWITYEAVDAPPAAAAMLQAFVPSDGDGWTAMLSALGGDPARGLAIADEVGTLTSRMHAALASRPDDPAFPARAAMVDETAEWRASAEGQLAEAIASVSGAAHDRLVDLAPAIRARFADAFGRATGDERVSRIHGDYHLGQLLARRDGGFSVVDFEGEPARPLSERRRPSSPLRDVAAMLRSLDYAARTAERAASFGADAWLRDARDRFLGAYGADGPLLDAFELEKACYEIRYEAGNRPDWLWLPLAAVERLVAGGR